MFRFLGVLFLTVSLMLILANRSIADSNYKIPLIPSAWNKLSVPGETANKVHFEDGRIEILSNNSVSFLYHELDPVLGKPLIVQWDWQLQNRTELTDQSLKGQDDRPLAVHLWFDDGSDGSLFGSLGSLFGFPRVGHLITYVWGARQPSGTLIKNPHYDKGIIVILHGSTAPGSIWKSETRDINADFRSGFGHTEKLPSLRYVALSADTDGLAGKSAGAIRNLLLSGAR